MKAGFPIDVLTPDMSALCLFCAAFGGKQDVEFIHKAGIKDVILVDNDPIRLNTVSSKYGYNQFLADAFMLIDEINESETMFDVVVCDQWTPQDDEVWSRLPRLKQIARKYLILGCHSDRLDAEGETYYRSDGNGGTYWKLIKI